jgi:methylmalonyl-CoA mutase cobalamin-binding subunit
MHEVTSTNARKKAAPYIIGKPAVTPANVEEVDLTALAAQLTVRQKAFAAMAAGDDTDAGDIAPLAFEALSDPKTKEVHSLSVELTEDHVQELKDTYGEALIIEKNHSLQMFSGFAQFEMSHSPMLTTQNDEFKVTLKVIDEDGAPVEGVQVDLSGELWSDRQRTNAQGKVTLKLPGETYETLTELRLKPASGFWSRVIAAPQFASRDNVVRVSALPTSTDGPQIDLWGNQAVGNVAMPQGDRVRVAVIDSGFADGHPDVVAAGGRGFADGGDPQEDWKSDDSGHGTHVVGTIGALNNAIGMRGIADRVDLFALRVFPGATIAKLIAAIDTAIELEVDVVNMSLGGPDKSVLLQQRMQAARAAGILLVAAAGNSGGPVMYPAAYPEVMAVAAIGKFGTFPEDSIHKRHETEHVSQDGQYFAAHFTCRGPQIDVCGPGVAVISTLPGPGFGSYDGTSMASPHVAGIAAVLLAQDAGIQAMARDQTRSDALFAKVVGACQPLGLPSELQGRGMPVLTAQGTPADGPDTNDNETPETPGGETGLDMVADLIRKAIEAARKIKESA